MGNFRCTSSASSQRMRRDPSPRVTRDSHVATAQRHIMTFPDTRVVDSIGVTHKCSPRSQSSCVPPGISPSPCRAHTTKNSGKCRNFVVFGYRLGESTVRRIFRRSRARSRATRCKTRPPGGLSSAVRSTGCSLRFPSRHDLPAPTVRAVRLSAPPHSSGALPPAPTAPDDRPCR